jgi:probable rRNA maturation factor
MSAKTGNPRSHKMANPDVAVSYAVSRRGLPSANAFRAWVESATTGAKRRTPVALSIRLVDADEGRELNRRYRDKDYATNVLSFAAELPRRIRHPLIGDLVICAPVVAHEASEQTKTLRDHYAHLTVHGVLHLLGYDHQTDADARGMEALERRILARLGIADPF